MAGTLVLAHLVHGGRQPDAHTWDHPRAKQASTYVSSLLGPCPRQRRPCRRRAGASAAGRRRGRTSPAQWGSKYRERPSTPTEPWRGARQTSPRARPPNQQPWTCQPHCGCARPLLESCCRVPVDPLRWNTTNSPRRTVPFSTGTTALSSDSSPFPASARILCRVHRPSRSSSSFLSLPSFRPSLIGPLFPLIPSCVPDMVFA